MSAPSEMTMTLGRVFHTAAMLAMISDVGHSEPERYNGFGRDAYGNTAGQNEDIRLRGVREKALSSLEKASRQENEYTAWLTPFVPCATLVMPLVIAAVAVYRRRR